MSSQVGTQQGAQERETLGLILPPVAAFAAGAGPVVLLAFSRGGYPVEAVAGYGVALWWLLVVGFATKAIPRPVPNRAGVAVLAALAGLVGWSLVSLAWSLNTEAGLTEVVRLLVSGGSVLLGMSALRAGQQRALAGGVLTGLTVVVGAAVITRLQPDLIAAANVTTQTLDAPRRTSWPLNYWNAIAAAAALAFVLAVGIALQARSAWSGAAASATIPLLALGLAFTLSRGGIVALIVSMAVAVAVLAPRPVLFRDMVAPVIGAIALLVASFRATPVWDAVGGQAQTDAGLRLLALIGAVTVAVALIQAGWALADKAHWTPRLPRPSNEVARSCLAAGIVIAAAAFLAVGGPGSVADAWREFKVPRLSQTANQDTSDRLTSVSSNERYQMWAGAVDAVQSSPIRGVGIGSWEPWWAERREETQFVRNAHSEPLELAAELGIPGLTMFAVFLALPIGAGLSKRSRRSDDRVFAVPALCAFAIALLVDWNWQISAFAVAGSTLAAIPLARADLPTSRGTILAHVPPAWRRPVAVGASAVTASVSVGILATALIAPQSVATSRAAVDRGDLRAAIAAATEGKEAASFASSPALQLALVSERAGRLDEAAQAAEAATQRTPADWRGWFVRARIAVARGRTLEAVDAFRRAKKLNPQSEVLRGNG